MNNNRNKIYNIMLGTETNEFMNFKGFGNMVMEQINSCDIDLRKEFY